MREGQAGCSSTLRGALSVQNRRQPRGLHRLPGPPGSDRKDRLAARSERFHADPPAGTPSPDARRDPLGPRRLGVSTARWEEAPRTGYLGQPGTAESLTIFRKGLKTHLFRVHLDSA
ncbi:unnamed protein product [Boreogadus saida]